LERAKGPVAMILPEHGLGEWDRVGGDLHDAEGLACFLDEMRATLPTTVQRHDLDAHINDAAFAEKALEIFDAWRAEGVVRA
ncbi:MAG: Tm-1-like ATP-binding domain-containing protein, partial [Pseudomonadota bacterium]